MAALIVLLIILIIAVTLALLDISLYAQMVEEIARPDEPGSEERYERWAKTPDGIIAKRPMGAFYLWARSKWKDYWT